MNRPVSFKSPLAPRDQNEKSKKKRAVTTPGRFNLTPKSNNGRKTDLLKLLLDSHNDDDDNDSEIADGDLSNLIGNGLENDEDDDDVELGWPKTVRETSARYGRRSVASNSRPTSNQSSPCKAVNDSTVDFRSLNLNCDVTKIKPPEFSLFSPPQNISKHLLSPNEKSLEESWSSLSFFNQKQRGRLSRRKRGEILFSH